MYVPYAHHYKPLLIRRHSWIQAIHKGRIFWKNLLKNKEMVFENGVKNIQAAACNGACTVVINYRPNSKWKWSKLSVLSISKTSFVYAFAYGFEGVRKWKKKCLIARLWFFAIFRNMQNFFCLFLSKLCRIYISQDVGSRMQYVLFFWPSQKTKNLPWL